MEVVRTFHAFLEFCYIARRSVLTEDDLDKLKDALVDFHYYRSVFVTDGVREKGISLPRQHALVHYHALIRLFGAPNGLCTSLSESKHCYELVNLSLSYDSNLCVNYQAKSSSTEIQVKATIS